MRGCVKGASTTPFPSLPAGFLVSTERAARREERAAPLQPRELELRRDIAEAFFNAQTPQEVYRLALSRVTPLVNASFSSVFTRDAAKPELLRLRCANSWPQSSARFLGQLRIRVGGGPTGRAVAERRAIEVPDLFGDIALRDWWEPARELGFAALISLPLHGSGHSIGAVTFYYDAPHDFTDEERGLLHMIAQQLSVTAERAARIEQLHRTNDELMSGIQRLRDEVGAAEEMQRLKTEFLSNISHELRTPLTSILGYTYLLLEGQAGRLNDSQSANLQKIDGAANALLHLINDLLTLTALKLGRGVVNAQPDDAVLIAKRATEYIDPTPAVRFRLEPQTDRIPLRTDADKVLKILENLLSNAFKFTRDGEVVLTVRSQGSGDLERIEWIVRDTGTGIPLEEQERIFDEFQQVDGSATRVYGGTGLGLALSRELATLLGGELQVESEVGRGSTFTLRLSRQPPRRLRLDRN